MTSSDKLAFLDIDRNVFDSDEARILSIAFEKAWLYVGSDPTLEIVDERTRKSELARRLMTLLKLGETNPTSLANSAINSLHDSYRKKPRSQNINRRSKAKQFDLSR